MIFVVCGLGVLVELQSYHEGYDMISRKEEKEYISSEFIIISGYGRL
jgi:hypothetical protein